MIRVWLDEGHGGTDSGAVAGNIQEKDLNLAFGNVLHEELTRAGFLVHRTRTADVFVSLEERARLANEWDADVFISLHADAAAPEARGHHVIHSIHNDGKLARLIVENMPGKPNGRGAWSRKGNDGRDYYAVIRLTRMQAVIIERGFVTNPQDRELMGDPGFTRQQAKGVVKALQIYFNVQPKPQTPVTVPPKEKLTKFHDVPAGHPYEDEIKAVSEAGLMVGYEDGSFRPGEYITRGEMAVILSRLLKRG